MKQRFIWIKPLEPLKTTKIFDDTPGDGIESNFKASLPDPPRDYSYAWGSGADTNEQLRDIII